MMISINTISVLAAGALLLIGKMWATRCFYGDCRRPRCQGLRFDPSREFPDGH